MSFRTTPLWVRTSGPFEPSPGNGPAVSSGIVSQLVALAAAPLVEAPAVADEELETPPPGEAWLVPQPTSATSPALMPEYAGSVRIRRRSSTVSRPTARPRP